MSIFSNLTLSKQDEEIAEVLKNINIFSGLTPLERVKIAKYFLKKEYEPKARIVKEGEPGDGMFVIQSGAVKVVKQLTKDKINVLANLVDGDFFGEIALLDRSPRSASVDAISPIVMLELYRASLLEFIEKQPRIGVKVLMNLSVFCFRNFWFR